MAHVPPPDRRGPLPGLLFGVQALPAFRPCPRYHGRQIRRQKRPGRRELLPGALGSGGSHCGARQYFRGGHRHPRRGAGGGLLDLGDGPDRDEHQILFLQPGHHVPGARFGWAPAGWPHVLHHPGHGFLGATPGRILLHLRAIRLPGGVHRQPVHRDLHDGGAPNRDPGGDL